MATKSLYYDPDVPISVDLSRFPYWVHSKGRPIAVLYTALLVEPIKLITTYITEVNRLRDQVNTLVAEMHRLGLEVPAGCSEVPLLKFSTDFGPLPPGTLPSDRFSVEQGQVWRTNKGGYEYEVVGVDGAGLATLSWTGGKDIRKIEASKIPGRYTQVLDSDGLPVEGDADETDTSD